SDPAEPARAIQPGSGPLKRYLPVKQISPPAAIPPRGGVNPPLPEGRLSQRTVVDVVTCVPSAPGRRALAIAPALPSVRRPVPSATLPAPEVVTQAPPRSALPQPEATVRENASRATTSGAGGGSVTVTLTVTVPVAPSSSVTVSSTGYVPAVA